MILTNCQEKTTPFWSGLFRTKIVYHALVTSAVVCFLLACDVNSFGQVLSPRSYLFVEVKDTAGKVLPDAAITVTNAEGKELTGHHTGDDGVARVFFPPPTTEHHFNVRVSKPGYLPSEHIFFAHGLNLRETIEDSYRSEPQIIVLRAPPTTPADIRALELEEQKHQLILAAKRGDPASLRKLLQAGVRADTMDLQNVPAIVWAAFAGDPETIKALLAAGARVRNKNSPGHQALLLYLAEGLPRESRARTPESLKAPKVKESLRAQRDEIVRELIKKGADIHALDTRKDTVLNLATARVPELLSNWAIKTLIAAGADVNRAAGTSGNTPLMLAAGTTSLETVKTLIAAGASVEAKNERGTTALMNAARTDSEIVKTLLAAGADVNAVDKDMQTPLIFAARYDLTDAVSVLLRAGASINAKDNRGETPLLAAFSSKYYVQDRAVTHPHPDTIKELIAAGANVEDQNAGGQTPLVLAAQVNSLEAVNMLLAAGASVNLKKPRSKTVLMYDRLWSYTPSLEIFKRLIAAGADVHAVGPYGQTPLMFAAQDAPLELVQLLLASGARVNVHDDTGRTPLFIASFASGGYAVSDYKTPLVKALIEAGANVNDVDNSGRSPLMNAAWTNSPATTDLLLAAGANVNLRDNLGQTALIYAAYHFNDSKVGIVKSLLAAGADINVKDNRGYTALAIAQGNRHDALIKLLEASPKP